jgi:hypothetical protein
MVCCPCKDADNVPKWQFVASDTTDKADFVRIVTRTASNDESKSRIVTSAANKEVDSVSNSGGGRSGQVKRRVVADEA